MMPHSVPMKRRRKPSPAPRTRHLLAAIAGAALVVPSAVRADPVDVILSRASYDCTSYENGSFDPGPPPAEVDLDGDGTLDRVLDESLFSCSSAASMYCGSGGCMLHAVIGDRVWSFQAEGWKMIEWNERPILLIARDGGWCGGIGAQLCYEAVVWSDGEMLSVMPPLPQD